MQTIGKKRRYFTIRVLYQIEAGKTSIYIEPGESQGMIVIPEGGCLLLIGIGVKRGEKSRPFYRLSGCKPTVRATIGNRIMLSAKQALIGPEQNTAKRGMLY